MADPSSTAVPQGVTSRHSAHPHSDILGNTREPVGIYAASAAIRPDVSAPLRDRPSDKPEEQLTCRFCKAKSTGRNLILCFDGTSNQFGKNNTNVIELYSRIIKDATQLTYYNSGIGTYARPSWRSYTYWKQVVGHNIDLAIAWNFERVLLAGYRWLADNYLPGDKIFLFGFSRGAYQIRALAAMIKKVGLILPGNDEQIPFAFELYADLRNDLDDAFNMADRFKKTFARGDVRVHFIGAWDTVSSVGLIRDKSLPGTCEYDDTICYFRHALALDERRVKFMPEYVCGGDAHRANVETIPSSDRASDTDMPTKVGPDVKEVWFAGCHSDIGGGSRSNTELNNASIPVLWMGNEAMVAGLRLHPSEVDWKWEELKKTKPTESMNFVWRLFEILPFKRLSYVDRDSSTWWPNLGQPRVIKPGQKIHASVSFIHDYTPQAIFAEGMTEKGWDAIAGIGRDDGVDWANEIKDIMEMDLFDHSLANVKLVIEEIKREMRNTDFISRLKFMASTREGAYTIAAADSQLTLFNNMLKGNDDENELGLALLSQFIVHGLLPTIMHVILPLHDLVKSTATNWITGSCAELIKNIAKHHAMQDPEPIDDESGIAHNVANIFLTHFFLCGNIEHLERSIALHREALHLRSADLEESIVLHQEVLHLTPTPHPGRSASLNNLGNVLSTRFEQKGQLADLEESIALHQEALHLTPTPHPGRSASLNNLGNVLSTRFEQKGQLADLEESIALHQEALHLTPTPHPDRSKSLNNLGNVLSTRFQQEGQLADLEKSIVLHQEALHLTPTPHPDRSASFNSLATVLSTRFEQKGQFADLEESIVLHREALNLTPAPHPDRSKSLNNLGTVLSTRFQQKGQLADLEESIALHREALHLTPTPHPDRSKSLNHLGNVLSTQFEQKGQLADLEESIVLHREALHLTPAPHPGRSASLNNLATVLSTRFEQKGELADLEESMSAFRDIAMCTTGSVILRLRCSRNWANRSVAFSHSSSFDAYQHAIDLLPSLASLDKNIKARYQALSDARGLASDACAFAIRSGQLKKAVEFISAGRAVFWSQALHLRPPLDELAADEPELAAKLRTIAGTLERASLVDGSQIVGANWQFVRDMEKEASRYRVLSEEWDHTLAEVRSREKFKHFLQPKPFVELQRAARNGPIVILNASTGCDGLLITRDDVHHVPFPALTRQDADQLAVYLRQALVPSYNITPRPSTAADAIHDSLHHLIQAMGPDAQKASQVPNNGLDSDGVFRFVLRKLWLCVAQPVIQTLKLQKSDLPTRMWWCPTGPFAFLPIHAAGIYDTEESECLSDYAISSYTPTLEALLVDPPVTIHPFKLLTIIQPEIQGRPGYSLPHARKELEAIQLHVPNEWLITLGTREAPTSVAKVLDGLSNASWAHFACHGTQDPHNPLDSALHLDDGKLKASMIIERCLPNASLAVLSACHTAAGDEQTPDEVIHLSATLLFAGFRGVVGTMWSIFDEDAPDVADVFYSHLFKGQTSEPHINTTEAALALHLAVKKLRVEKKVAFRRWVPFIHLGL